MVDQTQSTPLPEPEDTLEVNVGGSKREVFMSFGLLNELSELVSDVEHLTVIHVDPVLKKMILSILLAERDEAGKIKAEFNLITSKLSKSEATKLLSWTADHIMSFLVSSLEATQAMTERHGERIKKVVQSLTSSQTGTEASASEKPSATPSTSSPAA